MAIDNTLTYEVVPIQDAFGPTKSEPDLDVRTDSIHKQHSGFYFRNLISSFSRY